VLAADAADAKRQALQKINRHASEAKGCDEGESEAEPVSRLE
jgi:hypothetical protein